MTKAKFDQAFLKAFLLVLLTAALLTLMVGQLDEPTNPTTVWISGHEVQYFSNLDLDGWECELRMVGDVADGFECRMIE